MGVWQKNFLVSSLLIADFFEETEKSLTLQYTLSDGIIVFDIPHYMTPMALWGKDDWKGVYKMHHMKQYIEYYSTFVQE